MISLVPFLLSLSLLTKEPSIEGRWRVIEYSFEQKGTIKLARYVAPPNDQLGYEWGHFIEFNPEGTFEQHASAPCGMDDNHFRFSGNWKFEGKELKLTDIKVQNDRPNIYHKYRTDSTGSLTLVGATKDELIFSIGNHWEHQR